MTLKASLMLFIHKNNFMFFNGLLLLFSMFPPKGSHQSKFNWNYKHVKNYIVIHLISSQTKFPNVAIKKCLRYIFTMSELFDGRVIFMKIWHLSNVQMLSWRNRSWKIRCFRLEMLFQKWWYPISSFAHSVSTDLAIFLVSVYRRVCWILKVFRVCNFFSQQSGKLAKFLMPLCIIKIFSEHGFDSDQIQKYFNEIVKLFIPRKVTIMSLINGSHIYTTGYLIAKWIK